MPGKINYPVFILSIIFLILFRDQAVMAQQHSLLDRKVSFTFTNMPLSSVLRTIGTKAGVKFSYNPELLQAGRRITMKVENLSLRELLKQLLNDPSISYREIGNQIVLYRGDISQALIEPNQTLIQGKPQIIVSPKKNPDTVYVYQLDTLVVNRTDTVFRSISIIQYDTIRRTDTIYVEKNKPPQKPVKDLNNKPPSKAALHRKFLEENGFYSGIYFEMLPGSAALKNPSTESADYLESAKQTVAGSITKFSTGFITGYDYYKIGIRSGIGYTQLGEKFDYSYKIETGGFFKTDTVEKYYSVTGVDTAWFYLTDSTWIPKDSKQYSYQNANSYKYIDLPVSVKFRFWQKKSAEIYSLGGINLSFLVSTNALHINPDNTNEVLRTSLSDLNPVLFSWHAGIGSAIKLSPRSGVIAEACYRRQINGQYKNIPLEKRYGLISVKIGAFIKF